MGTLEAPQDKHGHEPPERNRQRRPWRSWELWRPWRSWELWRPWRSWELWRPWRCRELRRPWQVIFGALALVPSARPPQPEPFLPPQKISLGYLGGIKSPPGLNRQDKTGTGQPTGTGSPPGLSSEAEDSSGHDEESGALTGSLSNRFHLSDKGAGG